MLTVVVYWCGSDVLQRRLVIQHFVATTLFLLFNLHAGLDAFIDFPGQDAFIDFPGPDAFIDFPGPDAFTDCPGLDVL